MIGLAARSDPGDARDFSDRYGVTFRMFWDRGSDSWSGFGVWGTPTSILVSRSGTRIGRWTGVMDEDERAEALRLARERG